MHETTISPALRNKMKLFYLSLNIKTEGLSFFMVVPFVLLYVWANIQLTPEQYAIFNKIWPPAFVFGVAFVLVNNWIVLIPVLRYFKKIIKGVPVASDEYARAKNRFLMLPYIHAVGAFFRWIILLANAIVPTMIFAKLNTAQTVNMWTGVAICSILGVFTYFSITEVMVQGLLKHGLFSEKTENTPPPRLNIFPRLTLIAVGASLLTSATLFAFFYITVESYNIAGPFMYVKIIFLMFIANVAGLLSPYFMNKTIRDKVRIVENFLSNIGKGNLDAMAEEIAIQDEISMINHSVDEMRQKLKITRDELIELNLNLEQKVASRTEELQGAMEELEAMNETLLAANTELEDAQRLRMMDLAMAANVQKAFLPESAPASNDYDIEFVFRPAAQVSGDFYDFYSNGGSLHGVGIYDVSGHGISSSLLTIIARSIIQRNFTAGIDEKLNRVVEKINRELIEEIGQSDKYITGIMLRFLADRIEYVNSGHPDAFFKIAGTNKTGKITNRRGESVKGMFLGVASMEQVYDVLSIRLNPGDFLFIYSDCFIETTNGKGDIFGEDGVKQAIATAPEGSAGQIMHYIIKQLYEFIHPQKMLSDDLTAMVIRKK